jgi:DNA-binding NarL/FixJ family response regulator
MIRVVIADDQEEMRHHAQAILAQGCELVGEAADGQALLDLLPAADPDVVVMDISMPRVNGIDATRRLKRSESRASVVLLTVHDSDEYARAGLACGSVGYVVKSRMALDLPHAVRAAARGEAFVSPTEELAALASSLNPSTQDAGPRTPAPAASTRTTNHTGPEAHPRDLEDECRSRS